MTNQKPPSTVAEYLAAAGAEVTAVLAESGLRVVASAALGQVIAGLPDAARGMVRALPLDHRYSLSEAVTTLLGIVVDELPESADAEQHQADTSAAEAQSLRIASLFATAYRDDLPRLHRQINDLDPSHDELKRIRDTCHLLFVTAAALMPSDGAEL